MKLSEKIYYCRKKSGKSQEALAEQLGVSRQAVSKWETGDAEPEIGKLKLLADAFGVTVDWLLSDDEPAEETGQEGGAAAPVNTSWVDSVPGVIGTLLRRYGWLIGVYTALGGVVIAVIGVLARVMIRGVTSSFDRMTDSMFDGFGGGGIFYDEFGNLSDHMTSSNDPVFVVGTVVMVIGIILTVGGVVLAVVLKRRNKDK